MMTDLHLSQSKQPLMNLKINEVGYLAASDTTLRLNCSDYQISKMGRPQNLPSNQDLPAADDGCHLVLGLGPTSTCFSGCDANDSGKSKDTVLSSSQILENNCEMLELGLSRGYNELEIVAESRGITNSHHQVIWQKRNFGIPVDESSTSAKRSSGGYMPALLFAPRLEDCIFTRNLNNVQDLLTQGDNINADSETLQYDHLMSSGPPTPIGSATGTLPDSSLRGSGSSSYQSKKCSFSGCTKGSRGATSFCIGHGGGQRCQKPGCNKGAESRTAFCKTHGGGRRCQMLGCTKSAEGKTDYCIAHGGGRRCCHSGCTKAARGKSGLCIRHGGGKRCSVEGCIRSAEGQAGVCISHGGGRRCQYPECKKGAQGSTKHCKAHGGGRRCVFEGCTKGAEGSTPLCKGHGGGKRCKFHGGGLCPKSVHGGTEFCVAHGGGKRCAFSGCTKSARGRTNFCVRHGGGKRCHFVGCTKSAQGSTDFCKAHGGGKRCIWSLGCDKFARGRNGLCAAHGNMASQQEKEAKNKHTMISSSLFHGIVSSSITVGSTANNQHSSMFTSFGCVESQQNLAYQQLRIPPQVLVPESMKSLSSIASVSLDNSKVGTFVVPEGRVHGGSLLSLLGGSFKDAVDAGLV